VAESFILCGHQAFRTHIKNIAVFVHKDDRMEVAQGRFSGKEGEADLTRLESGMSFMQVRASMSMKEKLRQVRGLSARIGGTSPAPDWRQSPGRTTRTASYPSSDEVISTSRPGGGICDEVLPGGGCS
jgi:hypothetical protein